jgi:hypothetical protein
MAVSKRHRRRRQDGEAGKARVTGIYPDYTVKDLKID